MDDLTFTEQIRIIMRRHGVTVEKLGEIIGVSKQNLNQQMKRDNFREQDMKRIAQALNCAVKIEVIQND